MQSSDSWHVVDSTVSWVCCSFPRSCKDSLTSCNKMPGANNGSHCHLPSRHEETGLFLLMQKRSPCEICHNVIYMFFYDAEDDVAIYILESLCELCFYPRSVAKNKPRGRCQPKIWELLCQPVVFLRFLSVLDIYTNWSLEQGSNKPASLTPQPKWSVINHSSIKVIKH